MAEDKDKKKRRGGDGGKKRYIRPLLTSFGLLSLLPGTAAASIIS